MDWHLITDIGAVVVSVFGGYLVAIRRIEDRLAKLETFVAILKDREKQKRRLDDSDSDEGPRQRWYAKG